MDAAICQIGLPVRDLNRAVGFYRDKLGSTCVFETPNAAFFACGDVRLMLGPPRHSASVDSIVYFKVDDIGRAVEELKSRGVSFDREPHLVAHLPDHDLWMAFFRDSEENSLALMCEKRR